MDWKSMKTPELLKLKNEYDDLYYNAGELGITDADYDLLKEELIERGEIVSVGAKLRENENEVPLPIWLGSMDKIKDDKKLKIWLRKNPAKEYVISEKLDGLSALLILTPFEKPRLYTRGNGKIGVDISTVFKYFKSPRNYNDKVSTWVRGELIIKRDTWKNSEKFQAEYSNPRSMAFGAVKSKSAREGLNQVEFIGYEFPNENAYKMEKQLKIISSVGIKVVNYKIIREPPTIPLLSKILAEFTENSEYDIDGLIVQPNVGYTRNIKGNPDYAFAYKEINPENIVPATIKNIEWNISVTGALKPRIEIHPISLQGVEIKHTTGFNAKFIKENKLNIGSIVNITRSGDVIPYIVSVVKCSETPLMPENIPFYWGESEVDIHVKSGGFTMSTKLLHFFFSTIGAKHVALKTIEKIYNSGHTDLLGILRLNIDDLMKIENIKEKSATRIYDSIHTNLAKADDPTLMAAIRCCGTGVGIKKLKELFKSIPNILVMGNENEKERIISAITAVNGFSDITAEKIYNGITPFKIFRAELSNIRGDLYNSEKDYESDGQLEHTLVKRGDSDLLGQKFVFSGVRNKEMEENINLRGGSVVGSVSKNTTAVITNDTNSETGKVKKARDLGIKIIDINEFEM